MAKVKLEGGCIFHERTGQYSYSYTVAAGLNEYGDINNSTQHAVWFDPPTDGDPPQIGDFVNVGSSNEVSPNVFLETGTFERRAGIQVTEGRMRWKTDHDETWSVDWEKESFK